jgi:small neutral amino acid transporter SnatA (MarC family)
MTELAHHFTHVFFLVYVGLFPIVNSVGNAPIFLALTRYYTERERHG